MIFCKKRVFQFLTLWILLMQIHTKEENDMEKLLLCFLFKTQHKGCFDVLLLTLFSSLSTWNFIIGTEKKKMQIGLDYFIFRRYSICMPAGMLVWQHPIPEPALLALAQAMCASSWGICLYTMAHSHTSSFPWLSLTLLFCIFNYCAFATLLVPCCCAYVCPTQWAFGKGTLSLSMA